MSSFFFFFIKFVFFLFSDVDEHILHECLKFMEGLLDKSAGKKAMETFFTDDSDNGNTSHFYLKVYVFYYYTSKTFAHYIYF